VTFLSAAFLRLALPFAYYGSHLVAASLFAVAALLAALATIRRLRDRCAVLEAGMERLQDAAAIAVELRGKKGRA